MSTQKFEIVAWVEAEVIHADGSKDTDEVETPEDGVEEIEIKES